MAQRRSTATKTTAAKIPESSELEAAAALVMEREQKRRRRAKSRARKRRHQREQDQLVALQRMQHSIEVIKWSIVLIATIMVVLIIFAVWTLIEVQAEVEKVQTYVAEIEQQVDRVRESLRNPMQTIGGMFGKELDAKLNTLIGDRLGGGE